MCVEVVANDFTECAQERSIMQAVVLLCTDNMFASIHHAVKVNLSSEVIIKAIVKTCCHL